MKFHPLEREFFDKVLNATLDIPVNASIHLRLYKQHLDNDPRQYFYLQDLSQFYLEYMFLEFCGYTPQDYRGLMEQSL